LVQSGENSRRHDIAAKAMKFTSALALAMCKMAAGTELTKETWDSAVSGKTVFVKFLAPW